MKTKKILSFLRFLAVANFLGWFACVVFFLALLVFGALELSEYTNIFIYCVQFGILFFTFGFLFKFLELVLIRIFGITNKGKNNDPAVNRSAVFDVNNGEVKKGVKKPIGNILAFFVSLILAFFYFLLCIPFLMDAGNLPDYAQSAIDEINLKRMVIIFGILTFVTNLATFKSIKYKKVGTLLIVYWFLAVITVLFAIGDSLETLSESSKLQEICQKDQTLSLVKDCTFLIVTNLGHGSGFAVSPQYIVTNRHVIEGAKEIKTYVTSKNGGSETINLKVWGYSNKSDIAVLKVPKEDTELVFCEWADSDKISLVEELYAVGWPNEPFGDSSITRGIFSRYVADEDQVQFIQTDAPINPGNSGGPLVSACGIVGINTLKVSWSDKYTPSEGYGFAISSNYAKAEVERLIQTGSYQALPIPRMYTQASYKESREVPRQAEYSKEFINDTKKLYSNIKEAKKFWFNKKNIKYFDTKTVQTIQAYISKVEELANIVLPKIINNQSLTQKELDMLEELVEKYQRVMELEEKAFDNIKF